MGLSAKYPEEKGFSTYMKEYPAILMAVQQWRSYLEYGEFLVYRPEKL